MNTFTRSTLAAAQAQLRRCVDALEQARTGNLLMLSSHVHKALITALLANDEIDRAIRLDTETGDAA